MVSSDRHRVREVAAQFAGPYRPIVLAHGFAESDAIIRSASEAFMAAAPAREIRWIARGRYHARIRSAGWTGELIDEETWMPPLSDSSGAGVAVRAGLLADPSSYYLLDREGFPSDFYRAELVVDVVRCSVASVIEASNPKGLLFSDVPHFLTSYSLYLEAQSRQLPIRVIRRGPAPYLTVMCRDAISTMIEEIGVASAPPRLRALSESYVRSVLGSYDEAEPSYMKSQRSGDPVANRVRRKLLSSPRKALSPTNLVALKSVRRRQKLRPVYEALCDPPPSDRKTKCITLFLHLQPERSTVPEGGHYANQLRIAQWISAWMPDDCELLVREHPSTFVAGPRLVRSVDWYRAFLQLRRTTLVSTRVPAFELIDRSALVATVTGTVGMESVIRGTPVLVFGNAPYIGCPGVTQVSGEEPDPSAVLRNAMEIAASSDAALSFLQRFDGAIEVASTNIGSPQDGVRDYLAGMPHRQLIPRMLDSLAQPDT